MTPSLHTTALAFATALDHGFVTIDTVIAWIDRKMAELDKPPPGLIDACLAGRSVGAVSEALRTLPGELDEVAVVRQCFWHARAALTADPRKFEGVAGWLHVLAVRGMAPTPEAASDMCWFDDEIDLCRAGYKATPRAELLAAADKLLGEHAEPPG